MKKVILILILMVGKVLVAQSTSLNGKVTDKENKQPLNAATVTLHNITDSAMVTGAATDANGNFIIPGVKNGDYYLKISYIGYEPLFVNKLNIQSQGKMEIGDLQLSSTAYATSDVVVTGEKNLLEYNFDKKVINVAKDMTSVGGTALDILKNTPSVTVDSDGNVSLRGKQNVTILVDGQPRPMGNNGGSILEMIPAGMIDKIEIITNPSARYEASGDTGIINIITKKNRSEGFNTQVSLNAGTGDKYGGSTNLNYKIGDFNLYGSYNVNSNRMDMRMYQYRELFVTPGNTSYLVQNMARDMHMKTHTINFGFDYNLTETDKLNFSIDTRFFDRSLGGNLNTSSYTSILPNNPSYSKMGNAFDTQGIDLRAGYKKEFAEKGHELTADLFWSYGDDTFNNETFNQYYDQNTNPLLPIKWMTGNFNINRVGTLQIDYVNPIENGPKIEAGYKGSAKGLDNNYNYYNFDFNTNQYVNNAARNNNFIYNEQIHSLYGMYADSLLGIKYQLGLRGEQTIINADQKNINKEINRSYFDLFPSLNLNYMITQENGLHFSYSRRINRPNQWWLNPAVNYIDSTNSFFGNPELNPEYTNSFEFGVDNYFKDFDVTTSLFYKASDDQITQYRQLNSATGVFENTVYNIGESRNYGLELVLNTRFLPWLRINGSASLYKNELTGNIASNSFSNNSFDFTSRLFANVTLPENIFMQLMVFYMGPTATAQGTRKEMYWTDISFRKDFFNNKLSLTFKVNDIFKTMKFAMDANGPNFNSMNEFSRDSRIFTLGITWKLDAQFRQPDRKRPNGDGGQPGGDMMF
ncbi:MAG: TonB-dependent receptor [Ignavibacteriaceae bacterium]|nr:TonB-dependent receptor [Ignavibacteriaceae bacterium]